MSKSGLKRRATFEEALYLEAPNLDLPQRIASQLIDSPYLIKQMGDDLGAANDMRQEREDEMRAMERHAQQQNVPIAELRGVVAAMRPPTQFDPFYGQAAHEARAAQQEVLAKIEHQRVGLARMYQEQQTAREAQVYLAHRQGDGIAEIARYLAGRRNRDPRGGSDPGTRTRASGSSGATSSRGM
jgi:hypothetical protein